MTRKTEINNQLKIEKLGGDDLTRFIELVQLFEDVFEMKDFSIPDPRHLQKLLNRTDFYVFVAVLENKVVGGLTSYVLEQYYSEKPLAYLYDLAVSTNLQRQGIGRKLIAANNKFFKEEGFEEVFVQTDVIDDYAIDFYRSTKPTEGEQVVHFYYTLNK